MAVGKEILISFSSEDNHPRIAGDRGWVTSFCKFLTTLLTQIMKEEPHVRMIDESQQDPGEIEKAAVLIAILSNNFKADGKLVKGISHFGVKATEDKNLSVAGKARMFKVLKHPVEIDSVLPEYEEILPYDLFQIDPMTGEAQEYTRYFGSEAERSYWLKLVDMSYDIFQILDKLGSTKKATKDIVPKERTVYLASTGVDILIQRDIIKRELLRHGYRVLPEQSLPKEAKLLEAMVKSDLEKCRLSIHLIGEDYGYKPKGSDLSIVDIQNKIASEYVLKVIEHNSKSADREPFSRLIWLSPDMVNVSERQKIFIEDLKSDAAAVEEAEVLQITLQELKSIVREELLTGGRFKTRDHYAREDEDSKGGKMIYLICDKSDAEAAQPIAKALTAKGCEVMTSLFDGDLIDLRYLHQENLRRCDASLIYFGKANHQWIKAKLQDLLKAPGFGRIKPLKAKAIYVAGEAKVKAEEFKEEGTLILTGNGEFKADSLKPFLEKIEK
ncbi:DUF4062 domain-containing protein [Imperialibacter roseus]|uniref:DUF4062 domain-containing protein n=1 Tax=Imperialibacter roseus TaxID=1324217 RepID=A0ABZ0IWT0_9BACT|nr:DUF4062 domain-containing protein [Imperialibacter roseus]WOK08828.1 DUF4062 domain-containing protein [Imperialibacter roseus]